MTFLIEAREQIKRFVGKYESFLLPIGKFLTALITFLVINGKMGFMEKLDKVPIAIILALLCSFLPLNFIVLFAAVLVLLHTYALSMECALVLGIFFLLMFLLYFRFSPKDTFVVVLTPLCCAINMPYVIPLSCGLVGTPASAVSVSCGVFAFYSMKYIVDCSSALSSVDASGMASKFKVIIDGIVGNHSMYVMMFAFAATIIIVYFVRRMNIDYSWTIATIVGGLADVLILLVGDLIFTTNIPIIWTIVGTIIGFGIVKVIQFFVFNVDYARTEKVQFEDDEYYYYVKAVPKVMMAVADKKVKKVTAQKERNTRQAHPSQPQNRDPESKSNSAEESRQMQERVRQERARLERLRLEKARQERLNKTENQRTNRPQ